jgi:WD40-like Beta Propeller Repeat
VVALALATASLALAPCPHDASLGRVAFVRAGALVVYDFATCRERTVVPHGAAGPVRFTRGGLLLWGAGAQPPGGLRSADGRQRAVVRGAWRAAHGSQSIWIVDAQTGRGRRVFALRERHGSPGPLELWGWSPDARYLLFAIDPLGSASLAADGLLLRVLDVRSGRVRAIATTLGGGDFRAWCGGRLVLVAGADRIATTNKRLVVATPPLWRPRALARLPHRVWGGLSCVANGRAVAVETQPETNDANALHVRWSIWRVGLDGSHRVLTTPPRGAADMSPRWSRDGTALLFVRERRGIGQLELLRAGRTTPVTSVGAVIPYYGHLGWWSQADWTSGA